MSNVVDLPIIFDKDETPERILKAALNTWEGLTDVVIIGNVNNEIYVSGSSIDIPKVLGLIELGKYKLLCDSEG